MYNKKIDSNKKDYLNDSVLFVMDIKNPWKKCVQKKRINIKNFQRNEGPKNLKNGF